MKKSFIPSSLLVLITSFLITSSLFAQIPNYVPTNGLVGYWPFNGNANDESGNGNNGTVNGATLTTDRNGNANSAYSFDGVNNKIEVQHNQSLNIGIITISIWFHSNSFLAIDGNQQQIISKREYTGEGYNYQLGLGKDPTNGFNSNAQNAVFSDWTCGPSNQFRLDYASTELLESTWYHLVFIKNLSSTSLYINGIEVLTNSPSCEIPTGNTLPLWFGGRPGGGGRHFFNGLLDDIAIYNRALTQEEITALYNGATTIPGCTNTTACNYNASATQDDGSCTFPAQTYLNCAGACLNDTNNNGICDEVEATFPSYLPANGLVAWYPFNGNANDESGNGNNGTVNGATLTTDRNGNANSAYSFDGTTWIEVVDSPSLNLQSGSISFWLKANYQINKSIILKNEYSTANFENFGFGFIDNNQLSFYSKYNSNCNPGIGWVKNGTNNIYSDNSFHHIISTFDNAAIKLYIDGNLINTVMPPANQPDYCPGGNLFFARDWATNQLNNFIGQLDDIAIYNRALTPAEITALYTGTNSNGGNGNNTSSATSTVPAGISYQAVARNAQGTALANTAVQVKFTLITDSLSGTTEYVETHSLSTNSLGLFATAFGTGTAVTGTWAGINWTHSNKYLKVELDAGNGFVDLGTQQLLSSPFAIRAQSAATIENGALPVYSDNAAAIAGGLTVGKLYRTATGDLKVVY